MVATSSGTEIPYDPKPLIPLIETTAKNIITELQSLVLGEIFHSCFEVFSGDNFFFWDQNRSAEERGAVLPRSPYLQPFTERLVMPREEWGQRTVCIGKTQETLCVRYVTTSGMCFRHIRNKRNLEFTHNKPYYSAN